VLDIPKIPQIVAALERVRDRYLPAGKPAPWKRLDADTYDTVYGQYLIDSIHAVREAALFLPTTNPHRAMLLRTGLLEKMSGNNATLPDGRRVSVDCACWPTPDAEHLDFIRDAGGDHAIVWGGVHFTQPDRYIDVVDLPASGKEDPLPEPGPDPKPDPRPTPKPDKPAGPKEPYGVHTPLGREIGELLWSVPTSPYIGNIAGSGLAIAHLLWKVQFENYPVESARQSALSRARGGGDV
jgi:hypothetical protein